jgi:hypothetical protein
MNVMVPCVGTDSDDEKVRVEASHALASTASRTCTSVLGLPQTDVLFTRLMVMRIVDKQSLGETDAPETRLNSR